jgi:intergrase/recombinase
MFIPHIFIFFFKSVVATMVSLIIIFSGTRLSTVLRGNFLPWFQMSRHCKSKGNEEEAIHYWVFAKALQSGC